MSFLFRIKGVETEKARKMMTVLNFLQAGCGFLEFIACIMLGNIKQQTKDYLGSISDTTQKIYDPLLALYSIIGIFQVLFGVFLALALMGKLPFIEANKALWLEIVHYGLMVQFGLVCFVCLESSTQSTIFAAVNDTQISQFYNIDASNTAYKYDQSFVIYSRYLIAWAVTEFVICLPIAFANLYALHTRHINYEALVFDKEERTVPGLQERAIKNGEQSGYSQRQQNEPPLDYSKQLEVQMIER